MPGVAKPRRRNISGRAQYRIISTRFPTVAIFETLVEPDGLEIAYAIESWTNDRVQAEIGNLYLVDKSDWVTGPGATVVMAAFTHIGNPSRFSDGSYGVYYAALDEDTAIAETVFHAERFLAQTEEGPIELEKRCYVGEIAKPLGDIRGTAFAHLRSPDIGDWSVCQAFGRALRDTGSYGLLYKSVRHAAGECIAAFRPPAVTLPRAGTLWRYGWNGERIDRVLSIDSVRLL